MERGHRELGRRLLGELACIESRKDRETNKMILYSECLLKICLGKHLHRIRSMDSKLLSNGLEKYKVSILTVTF